MGLFDSKTKKASRPFEIWANGKRVGRAATLDGAIADGDDTGKSYVVMRDGRQVFVHTKYKR